MKINKLHILNLLGLILLIGCRPDKSNDGEPFVVGSPPQNAYTGLVKVNNNDVRHYGKSCFIQSKDQGKSWDTITVEDGRLYGKCSPISGEYLRLMSGPKQSVIALRSEGGIDGTWHQTKIDNNGAIMIKPLIYIRQGTRAIAGFHTVHRNGCGVYYSDDDGLSWKKSNQVNAPAHQPGGIHQGTRWNHGAVEPSIVELSDGRLWMLIRTARDELYESFSYNGGETWSEAKPSRFYGTITMPTLFKLSGGRILLLWCNTTTLPEVGYHNGYWEDVFTNRDAIHAAISNDDGQTWQGFRELYLNPLRNDSLMATRYGKMGSNDRSVQQSECIELDNGDLLVALGQHPKFRVMLKLHPDWLYEKQRSDNFAHGLSNWSVQKYIKGIEGHCAYNRKPGAEIMVDPDDANNNVMHIYSETDTTLLTNSSGGVFNFPAGNKGKLSFRFKLEDEHSRPLVSLHDRWFNPTDSIAVNMAMFDLDLKRCISKVYKGEKKHAWHILQMVWNLENSNNTCRVLLNGLDVNQTLPLINHSKNGISYVHFYLPNENNNRNGILIDWINSKVE